MEIQERTAGDVTILDLVGKIVLGDGDKLLRDTVAALVNAGRTKLLLNLDGVTFVDSAGLGEVVRSYTTATRKGGGLKLLKPQKRILDLLSITKLITVFEIFDDEQAAIDRFA